MELSLPIANFLAAFPDGGIAEFFAMAVKYLAVAGGVLVGWFVGAPVVRLLVRLAFHREAPRTAQLVGRIGSALLAGYLVYLLPLGFGGSGGFGIGGNGKDKGKGSDHGEKAGKDKRDKKKTDKRVKKEEPDKKRKEPPPPDVLNIRVLGGQAVKDERFFQIKIGDEMKALTEEEVRNYLGQVKKQINRVNILLDNESVDDTTLVVTDLVDLCKEYISSVRVVKEK